MDRQFRKLFYGFGIIMTVVSTLIIWRTVKDVIPIIGMEASALYLGMAIFFFCVGVGLILFARWDTKKEAKREAARLADEEQDSQ
jgi:cbb3-type cytochrome oxidase subunit 3